MIGDELESKLVNAIDEIKKKDETLKNYENEKHNLQEKL